MIRIEDDIEVELKGLITVPMLQRAVEYGLGEAWRFDLDKWQKERRIESGCVIQDTPLVRRFKIPVFLMRGSYE